MIDLDGPKWIESRFESSFQVRLAISMLLGALLVAGLIAWEPKQVDFSEDFDGLWILMGVDIG